MPSKKGQRKQQPPKRFTRSSNIRTLNDEINMQSGFDRGLQPDHIIGANELNGQVFFFVSWKNPKNNEEFEEFWVKATEIYEKAPQVAITFFEKNIVFSKSENKEISDF